MRKILSLFIAFSFILGLPFASSAVSNAPQSTDRKIVVFESGLSEDAKDKIISEHGVKIKDLVHNKNLKVANLSEKKAKKLLSVPGVVRVDDDVVVSLYKKGDGGSKGGKPAPTQPSQKTPWGVDRVGAPSGDVRGAGVKVAIIDTGIDFSHPDLADNIKGAYNAISPTRSANDDNGHGTHVAGTIGALDNNVGVVGVAPEVSLYAVKALDRRGSGFLSDIIEGIDWAIANNMDVINMSLGADSDVQSFHNAVIAASDAGIVIVAAAGNDGSAVDYPAAYQEVIAVSAVDSSDALASFSSRGSEVMFAAPGVSILSTWKGQGYKNISGTSMASPHVAGVVSALMSSSIDASYDLDNDSIWDSSEVKNKLKDTAEDLGVSGFDAYFGFGLVNLFNAL